MNDRRMEVIVSAILRTGVTLAGTVVVAGAALYLTRHGFAPVDYHAFHGEPVEDRHIRGIVEGVRQLRARSVMQLGMLLLIATPITRVAFSLVGFAMERDRLYVGITALVLAVLLYSLIAGGQGGL